MGRTLVQSIFMIVTILGLLIFTIMFITTVKSNITFWMLRPSETATLDMVGIVTALGGTKGSIKTEYKGFTSEIDYYIKKGGKMVCIIAQKKPEEPLGIGGVLTTINCFSTPFVADIDDTKSVETLIHKFEKKYGVKFLEIETEW